ncbi:exonuclease domain-containing protein [Streptomyces sp. NPDC001633]|uniref:3'-5' exonuclease n=1 Tax=Streptomyces sp. NPDC001633 TaxID=3364595 RepID=UPI0036AF73D8
MTATTTAHAAPNTSAQPVDRHGGIPVYRAGQAPAGLCTLRQLADQRRKLADDQNPRAYVRLTIPYEGTRNVALYDPQEAAEMRPLRPAEAAAYRARRTCLICHTTGIHRLPRRAGPWMPQAGPVCHHCHQAQESRYHRTCGRCGTEWQQLRSVVSRRCDACREAEAAALQVVHRLARRHCPDCLTPTATRAEVAAADAADPNGIAHEFPRLCDPCQKAREEWAEQARRAAERDRWDELGPVRAWARQVLAQPHEYAILDTETTGLGGDIRVVEIAVTDGAGTLLMDTLTNPGIPIPEEATAVHGITDAMVAEAPPFGAILPALTTALRDRRIIIYNRDYDTAVLANELDHHHRDQAPTLPGMELPADAMHPTAAAWMDAQEWDRCAMKANAVHVGEWSDYHGNWRWPRLNGGHRAAGDCRAVAHLLRDIAQSPDPF